MLFALAHRVPPFAVPIAIELVLVRDEPIAYAPAETDGELVADPPVASKSIISETESPVSRLSRGVRGLMRRSAGGCSMTNAAARPVSVESSDTSFR